MVVARKMKCSIVVTAGIGGIAEDKGGYYHPAVNTCFDRLSNGLSSLIQLESLISNINIAKKIE